MRAARVFLRRVDGYVARQGSVLIASRYADGERAEFTCITQAVKFLRGKV